MIPTWVAGVSRPGGGVHVATQHLWWLMSSSTTPERLQTCSHILGPNNAESHKCRLFSRRHSRRDRPKAGGGTQMDQSAALCCVIRTAQTPRGARRWPGPCIRGGGDCSVRSDASTLVVPPPPSNPNVQFLLITCEF